jgi:hypothetical protein
MSGGNKGIPLCTCSTLSDISNCFEASNNNNSAHFCLYLCVPSHPSPADVLTPDELAWLLAQRHRPLAVGQALSSILAAIDADSITKTRFDRLISAYTYEFGACNRIYNTAIPSAYTRLVRVEL